jgi:hypothetical protein
MARVCGPILGFRGERDGAWHMVVLVATESEGGAGELMHAALPPEQASLPPAQLAEVAGLRFWVYSVMVPVHEEDQTVDYGFVGEDRRWRFTVPGRGRYPRIAYASCNGLSQPGEMKKIADKGALWTQLLSMHGDQPYHLLLMGGDQIYADELWNAVPALRAFNDLPRSERVAQEPDASLQDAIVRFYAQTYRDRLGQPPVADVLACIPSVMMWDDHEIFDGWGSYSEEEQTSPMFRAIFEAARTCFVLFQLQSDPRVPSWPTLPGAGGFDALFRIRDMALVVIDLRSERSQRQVMSPQSWNAVFDAIDGSRGLRHLLVMSSIPVVHPDLAFLEQALGLIPGMQGIEDDLHDQWLSYLHRVERLRLVHRLLDFAAAQGTRVTILSGDVHVAALGVLESTRRTGRWRYANVINQLTSSAIVHPPPARIVRYFLEQVGSATQELDRDITAQMLTFPGTSLRIIAERNWLSLEFDDQHRIWANWHVEGREDPLTKVIHACEPEATVVAEVVDRGPPPERSAG